MDPSEHGRVVSLESTHWWYLGLRDLLRRLGRTEAGPALDVGCGTGFALDTHASKATGIDLSPVAVRYLHQRGPDAAVANAGSLPVLSGSQGIVYLIDVIYHRDVLSDLDVIRECARVIHPGGALLVQVPAFRLLANRHDAAVHGVRRYRRRDLAERVADAGLRPIWISYRNLPLFPVLLALRLAGSLRVLPPGSNLSPVPRLLNSILLAYLRLENRLLAHGIRIPCGSSLFCLARRE